MTPVQLASARLNAQERIRCNQIASGIPDVRALRDRLGLSQRELAERVGVSQDAVRSWEHGRRRPRGPAALVMERIGAGITKSRPAKVGQ